jgi:hypothetical protein
MPALRRAPAGRTFERRQRQPARGGLTMAQQMGTTEQGQETAFQSGGDRAEVQGLLNQMARALTAGDGAAVARLWDTPAMVLGDNMAQVVSSPDELARFFSGAKEQYNKLGITDTRADIVHLSWPTDRIALVEVRWPYLDANAREQGAETSTYTLRKDESGQLKLRVAVMHGVARND